MLIKTKNEIIKSKTGTKRRKRILTTNNMATPLESKELPTTFNLLSTMNYELQCGKLMASLLIRTSKSFANSSKSTILIASPLIPKTVSKSVAKLSRRIESLSPLTSSYSTEKALWIDAAFIIKIAHKNNFSVCKVSLVLNELITIELKNNLLNIMTAAEITNNSIKIITITTIIINIKKDIEHFRLHASLYIAL